MTMYLFFVGWDSLVQCPLQSRQKWDIRCQRWIKGVFRGVVVAHLAYYQESVWTLRGMKKVRADFSYFMPLPTQQWMGAKCKLRAVLCSGSGHLHQGNRLLLLALQFIRCSLSPLRPFWHFSACLITTASHHSSPLLITTHFWWTLQN